MRSNYSRPNPPLKTLGSHLKFVREKAQESLAEVSGAVEIDIDFMLKIENGERLPSEEVLLLLISHFDIQDDEAANLWELAGYNSDATSFDNEIPKPAGVINPEDLKIVYTDMVHVAANDYGVVMNFLQSSGAGNHPLLITRLGMSREHARHVMESFPPGPAPPQP